GDEAVQLDVFSLVDDPHSTTTELLEDAIVRDGLADHWGEILGATQDQVNATRVDGIDLGDRRRNIAGQKLGSSDSNHFIPAQGTKKIVTNSSPKLGDL
ncbi:MAG: hypothetical protein DMG71_11710, partial [Acidobacteria bacterium]